MTRPVIRSPTFRTRTSLSRAICNGVPLGTVIAMVWGSGDDCGEVDWFWKATICAGRLAAKAQANRKIERTRRDIMQEETPGRRGYVSATDLPASSKRLLPWHVCRRDGAAGGIGSSG